MSKRSARDEEDGLFDDDSDDDDDDSIDDDSDSDSDDDIVQPAKKKRKNKEAFIDDAAEESGEDDDEEDEEDEEETNDYIRDDFVVDDADEIVKKKKAPVGDLEDSDDDDADDDGDRKLSRLKKSRDVDRLDDDDLALIKEARGEVPDDDDIDPMEEEAAPRQKTLKAKSEAELRKGLFYDSDEGDGAGPDSARKKEKITARRKQQGADHFDEDGMDDFIEDDIGDQGQIMMSEKDDAYAADKNQVSEAQLTEASEIFGTEYLDFMAEADEPDEDEEELMGTGRNKYREEGVGVDLGVDSDDEILSDDDDDDDELFDDDYDAMDGTSGEQRREALKLKREKRRLAKIERRKELLKKKSEKRKAQLRRAFEPVQLVENFCTDRDDDIRQTDVPERMYDWKTSYNEDDSDEVRQTQAEWIVQRVPDVAAEFAAAKEAEDETQKKEILSSIIYALRFMHKDKLEPAFIKRYRKDDVTSPAVRENLYAIMDEDGEWARLQIAKSKVASLLGDITSATGGGAGGGESSSSGDNTTQLKELQGELDDAQEKLDETAKQEAQVKTELEALQEDDDDDDDDELFGASDDDDEVSKQENKQANIADVRNKAIQYTWFALKKSFYLSALPPFPSNIHISHTCKFNPASYCCHYSHLQEKAKEKERLASHLTTIQELMETRAEKVSQLSAKAAALQTQAEASSGPKPTERVSKKISGDSLWNADDYKEYLLTLDDSRQILDTNGYLNLLKEGNESILKKETPQLDIKNSDKSRKRSRRFNYDFYRTCVSEGLRNVCYRFLLAPNRVGIKLEGIAKEGGFDFTRTMPGEETEAGHGDPRKWVAPVISDFGPADFANNLIGSGELVLLSSAAGGDADENESKDPLRGCRYVAAMELSNEPRIRNHLRRIFRKRVLLTTKPTKKGLDEVDAFHDYYGLHLIRDKPAKDHFPMDEEESNARKANLGAAERNEHDLEAKKRQRESCLQYLNVLKAEQAGFLKVHVHLPLREQRDDWYRMDAEQLMNRANQDMDPFMTELERVYMPTDGDTADWNEERRKVLRFALTNFILPQFESEMRRDLRESATKIGLAAAAENLKATAMEGPYRPAALVHTENRFLYPTGDLPIVGVCCASDSRDATYLASVDEHGEANDHVAVPSGTLVTEGKIREKVLTFLLQTRPAAVVVGTSGGFQSRMLARKLGDLVNVALERWNKRDIQEEDEDDDAFEMRRNRFRKMESSRGYDDEDDEDEEWKCNVELIDDSIAQLFGRSIRGKKEFPDHAVNLRCAISVARHAKDPLGELTYAWSVASDAGVFGTEMLYLNVHPMQKLLPKTLLLREYERTLCDVVADVGTDINASCAYDHLRGLLIFVPGLGPRKASNLKQNVSQLGGGSISRRRDLLEKRFLGPVVYNNAVAFLRVRKLDQLIDQFLHPLDDTRLHPDVYLRHNWAVKIAFDALEREDGKSKDSAAIKALNDIMDNSGKEVDRLFHATKAEWEQRYGPTFNVKDWNPRINVPKDSWQDKVEELDLDAFANIINENGQGRWHSHLEMIKWEFRLPFADPRKSMEPLTGDKLFRLITGESDQSLRPGKELMGKVISNGDFGSRVKLEGDIPAFIPLRNMSDEHVESADDRISPGQIITAIITEVKKDHMSVDMSLRMDDFRKKVGSWQRPDSLPPIDDNFDIGAATRIEEDNSKKREKHIELLQQSLESKAHDDEGDGGKKRSGRVVRRACTHPAFRNAKNDEVDRELNEGGPSMVGEALIRPSSKSSDSLAVHWFVKEGSIKVIEVIEEDKETDSAIGSILKIKVSIMRYNDYQHS